MSKLYHCIVKTQTEYVFHCSSNRAEVENGDAFSSSITIDDPRLDDILEDWDREVDYYRSTPVRLSSWGRLTTLERDQLTKFAEDNGRTWKRKLLDSWQCATPELLAIRNKLGPFALSKLRIPEAVTA